MFVPEGFAHGFLVLSDTVDFMYKCNAYYSPGDEYGVKWNDPAVGIEWPPLDKLIVSEKDEILPCFADAIPF
jgi:dTDP-4-dehydrorhamnose 3,5-epimerase